MHNWALGQATNEWNRGEREPPRGGEFRGRPSEAMLQLALLPSITGFGSAQALAADSGSQNVTCVIQSQGGESYLYETQGEGGGRKERRGISCGGNYESVSLGFPGVLIGDDHGLQDVAELLEISMHFFGLRLPGQPPDEHLREGRVPELRSESHRHSPPAPTS